MRIVLTGSTGHIGSVVRRPQAEAGDALAGCCARRLPGGPGVCDETTCQAPDAARRCR
ncbi:hypothetical protein [Streptomyces violaceus]|uniref:Uncharacterized protein n=1 Tax=Streptomyces violaceus TaxID=1936 RepID=A0ABY9UMA6_STRVL|nr:hypothetical protein [Streptomyces janthinus]WND23464.1 hypothetical protein RI060_41760 [Streptomyces janthinus]